MFIESVKNCLAIEEKRMDALRKQKALIDSGIKDSNRRLRILKAQKKAYEGLQKKTKTINENGGNES